MSKAERVITVGQIDYANAWPIFDRFEECLAESGVTNVRIVPGVPSALNRALSEGAFDIATVSSFAYGQIADRCYLLPDLSVSANGDVMSILLFLKKPLQEALSGTIAVTSTSATSVNLLRIIVSERFGASPRYVTMEPDLDAMLAAADGALLIGDPAIKASWRTDLALEVLDVARLWKEWTGLGMTFAVAAVRREAAEAQPEKVAAVHRALLESKRRSLADPKRLVSRAVNTIGGSPAYWERYFRTLSHGFGPSERQGLDRYFDCAYRMGLLERAVSPVMWSDQMARVNE